MEKYYGCDMRGLLSFQILWLLSKKDMHGEEIAKEIEKRRGEKPKAGTLYPALKDLSGKGLILGRKNGKIVVYKITKKGDMSVQHAKKYFIKSFGEILST